MKEQAMKERAMNGLIPATVLGVLSVVMSGLMSGCATTGAPAAAETTQFPPQQVRGVPVFDGATGQRTTWPQLIERARKADIVLIGENHGHPLGLASAAAIWEDTLAGAPAAGLSMEFFERDEQSRVDDYLAGLSDEATFRKRTGRTDAGYPAGHRAMLESAKRAGRPVIAANAPRPYVRLARQKGYEALAKLTGEQRRLFRIPDEIPTGAYRENFDKIMGGMQSHGGPEKTPEQKKADLDAVFRSQSMWDWTMAESIVRAREAGAKPVVHVVGRFHVDSEGGTVLAVRKLAAGAGTLVVSFVDADSGVLREEDKGRADFVVYVGPSAEE